MTKPVWMETWPAEETPLGWRVEVGRRVGNFLISCSVIPPDPDHSGERAKLIGAAPAMVRALLEIEWCGWQDWLGDEGQEACPACGGRHLDLNENGVSVDFAAHPEWFGHRPECHVDAALTAAGLSTKQQRDEAREMIRRGRT